MRIDVIAHDPAGLVVLLASGTALRGNDYRQKLSDIRLGNL